MALLTKSPTKTIVIPQLRASTFTCQAAARQLYQQRHIRGLLSGPPFLLSRLNVMKRFPKAAKKFPLALSLSLSLSLSLLMFRWQLDFKCVFLNASALNAAIARCASFETFFSSTTSSVCREGVLLFFFFFLIFIFETSCCEVSGNFATTFQSTRPINQISGS